MDDFRGSPLFCEASTFHGKKQMVSLFLGVPLFCETLHLMGEKYQGFRQIFPTDNQGPASTSARSRQSGQVVVFRWGSLRWKSVEPSGTLPGKWDNCQKIMGDSWEIQDIYGRFMGDSWGYPGISPFHSQRCFIFSTGFHDVRQSWDYDRKLKNSSSLPPQLIDADSNDITKKWIYIYIVISVISHEISPFTLW